jgi:WD40 repeat protein
MEGNITGVVIVSFSPDGHTIASGGADGTVQRWNANDGTPEDTLNESKDEVHALAFSPDGQAIAFGGLGGMYIFGIQMKVHQWSHSLVPLDDQEV